MWEGGDLKYLCRKNGMSGNFATHDQCLWCYVPRSQLCSLNAYPARTVNENRKYAHLPPLLPNGTKLFPFTCPGCDVTYFNEIECLDEILTPAQVKSFPTIHKGVRWHEAPLSSTPISHMVPCVLHMRLRYDHAHLKQLIVFIDFAAHCGTGASHRQLW